MIIYSFEPELIKADTIKHSFEEDLQYLVNIKLADNIIYQYPIYSIVQHTGWQERLIEDAMSEFALLLKDSIIKNAS